MEVEWDQAKQLMAPGGFFASDMDVGGFVGGDEQHRLMNACSWTAEEEAGGTTTGTGTGTGRSKRGGGNGVVDGAWVP